MKIIIDEDTIKRVMQDYLYLEFGLSSSMDGMDWSLKYDDGDIAGVFGLSININKEDKIG